MGIISTLINSGMKSLTNLILFMLDFLPDSPFGGMIEVVGSFDFLPFLNWFIPFDICLTLLNVWLTAVGIYYIYLNWTRIMKTVPFLKDFFS